MAKEHPFSTSRLSRREFIILSAAGVLPAALAACQSGSPGVSSATPTPVATKAIATPRPTIQASPANADWSALAKRLQGTLVMPANPNYATALQLFDPQFDTIHPTAIAYCASPPDVQNCLAFARHFAQPFAVRAGGHSYAGYSTSTGLVIDVTRMNAIHVNANSGVATIGAGARLVDVYAGLAQQGVVIPAGSCPTVGVAGLTMGGGVGVLGRKFGLTCDNLFSAQVVLADGHIVTCDTTQHVDLFWALRGGGGGNFGIATSFTFQTHAVSTLSLFTLAWAWPHAADVFDAWQHWAPQAPDEAWSNCLFLATSNKSAEPIVQINGVYVGDTASLNQLLAQVSSKIGVAPLSRYVSTASILDTMLYEAGCYGKTVNECHLPAQDPQGQMQRDTSGAKSDYFSSVIPRQGIDALVNAIASRQASSALGEGGFGFDAYGGAINRVAPDATAFAHRNALFSVQYSANWQASDALSVIAANRSWLNNIWQAMRPYTSGAAYQNYIDPDLANWLQAYYGANLPRLQHVKATYDPTNLFHFAQSIPLV